MSRLHDPNGFVFRIVGDVRKRVEQLADAVPAVGFDHLTPFFLSSIFPNIKKYTSVTNRQSNYKYYKY